MKKRILQVTSGLNVGGLETVAMNIVRYSEADSLSFDFLVYGDSIGSYEKEAEQLGCYVIHMAKPKNYFAFYSAIKNVIIQNGPYDVVYSHTFLNSGIVLKAAKDCNVKCCIAHAHSVKRSSGNQLKRKLFYSYMRRLIAKYADKCVACSKDAGRYVFGKRACFEVIPNGIDTKAFSFNIEKRNRIREKLNIQDDLVLGTVGRLSKEKNQVFLVDLMSKINGIIPNAKMLIIGEGPDRNIIERRIKELKLEKQIILLGMKTNVSDYLCAMDFFLFPSIHEGLGISAIEAQCCGLITLCSDSLPKELSASELVYFLPINNGLQNWVNTIVQHIGYDRSDHSSVVASNGFSIEETAKRLNEMLL